MAESKLDEILRTRQFPGVAGLSSGPGSGQNELVFDKPDPAKDIPITLKIMEQNGQLKDPDTLRMARIKMEAAKRMPRQNIDYQKTGHPVERPANDED